MDPADDLHPLFMPETEGEEPPRPVMITIERTYQGTRESFGTAIPAGELVSLAQIAERWGGGTYRLRARNARGQIIPGGDRTYPIDPNAYPPRPLVEAPHARTAAPVAPPVAAPLPSSGSSPGADPSSLLLVILQMQQQQQAAQAAAAQQQHAQQLAMFSAMLAGERKHAEAAQQQLAQALQAMASIKAEQTGARHDPVELLTTGMRLEAERAEAVGAVKDNTGELLTSVATLVAGMQAAQRPASLPTGGEK